MAEGQAGFAGQARRVLACASARLFDPAVRKDGSEPALLQDFFREPAGVFVEVGANEPVKESQSFAFEQRGWTGVLVEPLSECVERLRRMRRAPVFPVAAGSPRDAGKQLPLLVAGGYSTLASRLKTRLAQPTATRLVPVRTLDSMLAESGIEHIDFLSIDVEGHELDVLEGFSIDRYRPRLILLEDDVHNRLKHDYLVSKGYALVRRTNLNNWYVPSATAFPVSLYGRWQLFRKMWLGTPLRRFRYALRVRLKPDGRATRPIG